MHFFQIKFFSKNDTLSILKKGVNMKFVVLGKYSTQGLAGFVKNPSDNRQEAAKK